MSQRKLDDLYDRLTSRKFLSFLLATGFLVWNFIEGRLDALQFQLLFWGQATTYGIVEGVVDFGAMRRPSAPDTVVTTNVDAAPGAPTIAPAATMRLADAAPVPARVRARKTKPAAPSAVLTEPVVSVPVRRPRPRPAVETEVTP